MSLITFQNFYSIIINNEEAAYIVKEKYFHSPIVEDVVIGDMKMADVIFLLYGSLIFFSRKP
jgi:hypothetical protein